MKFAIAGLILLIDALLWLLPINAAVDTFRTNQITNTFTATVTGSGNVSATLSQDLFNANTSLVAMTSNNTADTPVVAGYTTATRALSIAGLVPSETALLNVRYSVDNFVGQPIWQTVLGMAPWIWILLLCGLPIVAVIVIVRG